MFDAVADLMFREQALDPQVKKARGVFYTPGHVVSYIVEKTLGRLLQDCQRSDDAAKLKILDPASGSGCFLLGAYQALLSWYRNRMPLTGRLQRSILQNNIFGVDIDAQTVFKARRLLSRAAGVDSYRGQLDANIRCGNSLIATDLGSRNSRLRPFDWQAEFPEAIASGGFDCVIGNPPYVFSRGKGFCPEEKAYLNRIYRHQNYQLNTYALFVEKSLSLLREGGICGLIVPSNWLTISSMKPFRDYLLGSTGELLIVNNRYRVFPGASVDTSIIRFTKHRPGRVQLLESSGPDEIRKIASVPARDLMGQSVIQIGIYRDKNSRKIVERIESRSRELKEFCRVSTGLKAYQTGKGRPAQTNRQKKHRAFHARTPRDESYGRYLEGADVCRYRLPWSGGYLGYGDWLAEPRRSTPFDGERLLVRQIPARPPYLVHATYTDQLYYNDLNSMVIQRPFTGVSIKYLLGLLNSKLVSFWFMKKFDKLQRKIFPQFKAGELKTFPVCPIDSQNIEHHDQLVGLVDRQLAQEKPSETIDQQIDALVYRLFGLSGKEIQHIEASGRIRHFA